MKVIGLVGRIGAGKDEVVEYLEERHGFEAFGMGDVVRKIAEERGVEPTRENLQRLGKECREERGANFLARKAVEIVRDSKNEKFAVNGIRNPEEVEALRDEFNGKFKLLRIDAKPKIRFRRLKERGRSGDPETFEEFKEQDENETEKFSMKRTFKKADYAINNNGRLEELHKKVDSFLKQINRGKS